MRHPPYSPSWLAPACSALLHGLSRSRSRSALSRLPSIHTIIDLTPNNALAAYLQQIDQAGRKAEKSAQPCDVMGERRQEPFDIQAPPRRDLLQRQPFTADDVIFSFCRTLKNETAIAGSFADITGNFTAVEAPDRTPSSSRRRRRTLCFRISFPGLAILSSSVYRMTS